MYHLKQQIDDPTLKFFDGRAPVRRFSFLTTLRHTFYTICVSEVAPVRVLAYFLAGEGKDVLSEHFSVVEVDLDGGSPDTSFQVSWPHVYQVLLRRFLTYEVLRKALDAVPRAAPEREDEGQFI